MTAIDPVVRVGYCHSLDIQNLKKVVNTQKKKEK
jgi:hypothetical protein